MKAIETKYGGYIFRSRLEAKWARFFDLCGWKWSYEPIDCNGWIPDFSIGDRPTMVEVKPFFNRDDWPQTVMKIEESGYRKPVALLGADPTVLGRQFDAEQIGWLFEDGIVWTLDFGVTQGNGKLGMCSMEGSWWNILWECNDPNCSHPNKWSRVDLAEYDILKQYWAAACNFVRWMPAGNSK